MHLLGNFYWTHSLTQDLRLFVLSVYPRYERVINSQSVTVYRLRISATHEKPLIRKSVANHNSQFIHRWFSKYSAMVCFQSQGTDLLGFQSDRRNSRINSRIILIIAAAAGLTPTKHNCSRSRFITALSLFLGRTRRRRRQRSFRGDRRLLSVQHTKCTTYTIEWMEATAHARQRRRTRSSRRTARGE